MISHASGKYNHQFFLYFVGSLFTRKEGKRIKRNNGVENTHYALGTSRKPYRVEILQPSKKNTKNISDPPKRFSVGKSNRWKERGKEGMDPKDINVTKGQWPRRDTYWMWKPC